MRLVVTEFISLDGVVQAPGGKEEDTDGGFDHGGWSLQFFDPETMGAALGEALESADALLFGRRTWQIMAGAWPERSGDPFSDRMNEIKKYVASTTLSEKELAWNNSTLVGPDDIIGEVKQLREQEGGDLLVMGSANLVDSLVSNGLVDEYRLMIEPIILGGGKQLFPDDGEARPLELVSSTTSNTGVLISTFRHA